MTKNEIIQAAKDRLAEIEAEASSLRVMLLAAGHVPAAVSPWRGLEPPLPALPILPLQPMLPAPDYIPPYMPVMPWTGGLEVTLGGKDLFHFDPGPLDLCHSGVRFDVSQQRYGAS